MAQTRSIAETLARVPTAGTNDSSPSRSLEVDEFTITANSPNNIRFNASLGDSSESRALRWERRRVERHTRTNRHDGEKGSCACNVPRLRHVQGKVQGRMFESKAVDDRKRLSQPEGLLKGQRSNADSQRSRSDSDSRAVEDDNEYEHNMRRSAGDVLAPRQDGQPVRKTARDSSSLKKAHAAVYGIGVSAKAMLSSIDLRKADQVHHDRRSKAKAEHCVYSPEGVAKEPALEPDPLAEAPPVTVSINMAYPAQQRRRSIAMPPLSNLRANSASTNGHARHRRRYSANASLQHVQRMTPEDYKRAERKRLDRLAPPKIGEPLGPYILRMLDPERPGHIHNLHLTEEDCMERWYRLEGSLRPEIAETKREYLQRMEMLHSCRTREERILHGVEMPVLGKGMQREVDETRWEVVEGSMRPYVGETQEEYRKRMVRPWLLDDGHAAPTPEVIAAKLASKMRWMAYCGGT